MITGGIDDHPVQIEYTTSNHRSFRFIGSFVSRLPRRSATGCHERVGGSAGSGLHIPHRQSRGRCGAEPSCFPSAARPETAPSGRGGRCGFASRTGPATKKRHGAPNNKRTDPVGMPCQRYGKRIAGRNFLPADRKTLIPDTNNRPPTGADRADVCAAALTRSACRRRSRQPPTSDPDRSLPQFAMIRARSRRPLSPHPNDKHLNDRI